MFSVNRLRILQKFRIIYICPSNFIMTKGWNLCGIFFSFSPEHSGWGKQPANPCLFVCFPLFIVLPTFNGLEEILDSGCSFRLDFFVCLFFSFLRGREKESGEVGVSLGKVIFQFWTLTSNCRQNASLKGWELQNYSNPSFSQAGTFCCPFHVAF